MKDFTNGTKTKKIQESIIKEQILSAIKEAKKGLTLLEIRKVIDQADRKLLRQLEDEGKIKVYHHFLHNSSHKFTHPETKKVEQIKGTRVNKYQIIERED